MSAAAAADALGQPAFGERGRLEAGLRMGDAEAIKQRKE